MAAKNHRLSWHCRLKFTLLQKKSANGMYKKRIRKREDLEKVPHQNSENLENHHDEEGYNNQRNFEEIQSKWKRKSSHWPFSTDKKWFTPVLTRARDGTFLFSLGKGWQYSSAWSIVHVTLSGGHASWASSALLYVFRAAFPFVLHWNFTILLWRKTEKRNNIKSFLCVCLSNANW